MKKQDQQLLKENIIEKMAQFKTQIEDLKELTKPIEPDSAIGRVSRMDAINNKSVNEAALRQKQNQLIRLEYALAHIGEKDFGLCIKCRKTIPMGRILIMPESKKCVSCASL